MKCKSCFVLVLFFCLSSVSLSAQEPESPISEETESETPQPMLSQRLRSLAERLKQATTDSRDDLNALLQERAMLFDELTLLQTEANESEKDLLSLKTSTQKLSQSLMSSINEGESYRLSRNRWRTGALIEGGILVIEVLVIGAILVLGG